ncbi:UNVERIFIED_CONTAM: hypothetical protein Slati_0468000 [Sesamum latifolium]|uniref:Uncharacterized protein n=1 Tax=Sesamum latifolium TaxID=2727402 RepID=A0AAW2XXY1_9LAMI
MDTQGKAVKLVNSKLTISKSSSSSTKSVGVTTRSMSKKIKDSSQMTPLTGYVQKDFGSPNHASKDDKNKSPPSSPRSVSSHPFTINVALVMVTNATTIEEQLASLTRAIEGLTKHVQEQDAQIARLIHKADNVDASHIMGKQVEAHDEAKSQRKKSEAREDYKFPLRSSSRSRIFKGVQGKDRVFRQRITGVRPRINVIEIQIVLDEEDSAAANVIMIKNGYLNSNKNSCNVVHGDDIEDELLEKEDSSDTDDCMSTITFTDEDLLLGSKPHNRPLFVTKYVCEQKVNRILIDGGSAVNILPLRILKELGIPIDELSNSRLMIQGFNQGGQRAVGIIRLQHHGSKVTAPWAFSTVKKLHERYEVFHWLINRHDVVWNRNLKFEKKLARCYNNAYEDMFEDLCVLFGEPVPNEQVLVVPAAEPAPAEAEQVVPQDDVVVEVVPAVFNAENAS